MRRLAMVAMLAGVLAGCARPAEEPLASAQQREWTAQGRIVSVDVAGKQVRIDHGEIPGLMAAMTMTFPVAEAKLLDGVAADDAVEFTLAETPAGMVVTRLRKLAKE